MPTLYAAFETVLLRVQGDPADWRAERTLDGRDLDCVTATADWALCGAAEGLYRSVDGDPFERVGRGVVADAVTAVARDPADPATAYAGTEPSAVYRSTDAGATWTPLPDLTDLPSAPGWSFPPRPHTHHVRWIEVDPDDPDHLYVAVEAGALVQSHDAGATWEDRVPSSRRDTHSMTTHPDAPGRAWAAAGDGYAETRDGGETWQYPQDGLDHRYVWSVAVDPADPETVLVSAASGPRSAHTASTAESYVYRREGDGPWSVAMDGLPDPDGLLRAVLARGETAGEVYAATNHGLYRSDDAGRRWRRLDVAWPDALRSQTPRGLVVD